MEIIEVGTGWTGVNNSARVRSMPVRPPSYLFKNIVRMVLLVPKLAYSVVWYLAYLGFILFEVASTEYSRGLQFPICPD